jgi:DNA replication protein DnaC
MRASTEMLLRQNLKALNLSHMLRNLEPLMRQARENGAGYEDFLLALSEIELQVRAENRLKRMLREAKFPLMKTLETFDFDAAPGLDRRQLREIESGEYVRSHRNVIFLGKSGTGKTHLATALGVASCKQGISTRFVTGCGLVNELIEAQNARSLSRLIQRYGRYGLVIVDELGYVPFSKEGSELLFQVLAERNERGTVIITTNLGFADWTRVFGDPTLTAALLDRLTHKAHIINCTWQSYRLKETLKMKRASTETGTDQGKDSPDAKR